VSNSAPLIVTTSLKATDATEQRCRVNAARWGLTYAERNNQGLAAILPPGGAALVHSNTDVHIATLDGRLYHHLGTAFIRLKSLERGDGDPLVRAGDLVAGDHILDTTFGLGRDSTVAARAIGPTGHITAVESSTALFHLANETLKEGNPDEHSAPVQLVHDDALAVLLRQPASSTDVVLIDPMFTTPKNSDAGFELLRAVADTTPLSQQWVRQARRVARRVVVVKFGGAPPAWFDEEQLTRVHSHSNATWYRAASSTT